MTEFRLPSLGDPDNTDADVVRWLVADGDRVEEGQPLLEVSSDKVNVEVPAPASGTLSNVSVSVGDLVAVGQLLATID